MLQSKDWMNKKGMICVSACMHNKKKINCNAKNIFKNEWIFKSISGKEEYQYAIVD